MEKIITFYYKSCLIMLSDILNGSTDHPGFLFILNKCPHLLSGTWITPSATPITPTTLIFLDRGSYLCRPRVPEPPPLCWSTTRVSTESFTFSSSYFIFTYHFNLRISSVLLLYLTSNHSVPHPAAIIPPCNYSHPSPTAPLYSPCYHSDLEH